MSGKARLTARPGPVEAPLVSRGLHELRTADGSGGGLLHVPPDGPSARPLRLLVSLHGAGGDPEGGVRPLLKATGQRGVAILAPASRGATWDAIRGDFGADLADIDDLLGQAFRLLPVAAGRVAIGGFSDGASYALALGLANADLFPAVVAFSPGFIPPAPRRGVPAAFVSHGIADTVLPIALTSRRIVSALEAAGIPVRLREFAGGHAVPPEVAEEGIDWLLDMTADEG